MVKRDQARRVESKARRPLGVLLLVNAGLFLAFVLTIDLGARLFFPRNVKAVFNDPQIWVRKRPFVVADRDRGFALKPGYGEGEYHVDSAGFRGPELPADVHARTLVLCLGESSTFGWMVGESETYPARLQGILDAKPLARPACVVNAGVPSYTSAQVLAYARQLLLKYKPDVAIVSVLWNDVLYSCVDNWMPDYLLTQQPAVWRQFLLRWSGVYRARVIQKPSALPRSDFENGKAREFYTRNLDEIVQVCKRAGVRVVLLRPSVDEGHIPTDGMKIWHSTVPKYRFAGLLRDYEAAMDGVARRNGVPVLQHRLAAARPEQSALFLDPVHLTGAGNEILAEDLAAFLAERDSAFSARHP